MRRTLSCWLAAASVAVAFAPSAAHAAPPPVAAVDVDALYKEGTAALQAGNFDVAYDRLLHAWKERQSFDIAANLALAERELGRRRDAAEHLAWALKNVPPSTPEEKRLRLKETLDALSADLGRITITVPDETHIFLDDKEIGVAPLETFFVDPGAHTLGAAHRTEGGTTVNLQLTRGQEMNLVLKLEAGKGPKLPEGGGPVTPPPTEDKPVWPAIVLGGVAGAGIAVGIAGVVVSASSASSAEDTANGLIASGGTCNSNPAACDEIQSGFDDEVTFRGLGIGGFVVGGLALAGMVTYLVIPGGDATPPDQQAFYFAPQLGDTKGFVVGGRF